MSKENNDLINYSKVIVDGELFDVNEVWYSDGDVGFAREDLLVVYKINEMYKQEVIDQKTKNMLIDLYRVHLLSMSADTSEQSLNSYINEDVSNILTDLLSKYGLLPSDLNLKTMIRKQVSYQRKLKNHKN